MTVFVAILETFNWVQKITQAYLWMLSTKIVSKSYK